MKRMMMISLVVSATAAGFCTTAQEPAQPVCRTDSLQRKSPVCDTPPMSAPEDAECDIPVHYCRPLGPAEWGNQPPRGGRQLHLRNAEGLEGVQLILSPDAALKASRMTHLNLTTDQRLKLDQLEHRRTLDAGAILDSANAKMLKLDEKYVRNLRKILTDEQFNLYMQRREETRQNTEATPNYEPGPEGVRPTEKGPEPVIMYDRERK